jgi:hypothetical protein
LSAQPAPTKSYRGQSKHKGSIYNYLLNDPTFKRWFENEKRGSTATAYERLRRMGQLHKRYNKLPADFPALGAQGATDFIDTMITEMEDEGIAPNYAANFKKALVSWLNWNNIQLTRRLKIKDRGQNVKYTDEQIPLPDEVQKVLDRATPREKTCISFMAYAGCRIEVLGDLTGENGLKLRDLPELEIKNNTVTFTAMPIRVIVRANLNKARHQYETFLNQQGATYFQQYIEWRMSEKIVRMARKKKDEEPAKIVIPPEPLTPDSPVVTAERLSIGQFLRSNQINGIIKRAITGAGYNWRPYVFRAFFAENMTSAERKRTIIEEDRVWWMGHKGTIEAVYTKTNKRLNPGKLTELREAYKEAAEQYLTPHKATYVPLEQAGNELKRLYLAQYGKMTDEEIGKLGDLTNYTFPQLTEIVEKRKKPTRKEEAKSPERQIMVPVGKVDEIGKYLKKGYTFAKEQPIPKHAILEIPSQ